jgi:small-conductance mechanosensitive channel
MIAVVTEVFAFTGTGFYECRLMDIKKKPAAYKSFRKVGSPVKKTLWTVTYLLIAAGAITVYFLLKLHVFEVFGGYREPFQKLSLAVFIAVIILAVAHVIESTVTRRSKLAYTSYNLRKMIYLLSWILILGVGVSFLFKNWYSAAVSLGLLSLILGFALQNPISSFIGWLYILIRQPYHIGDRIQIEDFTGDVVEVNYLDTTLWDSAAVT